MFKNPYKIIPKLQTERIFPSKDFQRAARAMKIGITLNAYIRIPNDKMINRFLGVGTTTYLADVWNPISPIGEIALATSVAASSLRYLFIKKSLDRNYKNSILKVAMLDLNSRNNTLKPPSSLYDTPKYALQPLV